MRRNPHEWKPLLWKNRVGLDSVSKRISLPERTMCLRCYANSGRGPNFKRGDIEYTCVNTVCYMGIFHEVVRARNALKCLDCHSEGGRIDWLSLGYEGDPLLSAIADK